MLDGNEVYARRQRRGEFAVEQLGNVIDALVGEGVSRAVR